MRQMLSDLRSPFVHFLYEVIGRCPISHSAYMWYILSILVACASYWERGHRVEDGRDPLSVPEPHLLSEGSLADTCGFPSVIPQWLFKCISEAEEASPHCWAWHTALKLLGDYQCNRAVISPM